MAKERKPTKAYQGLTRYISVLTLSLWFGAMALLTWAVAIDVQEQIRENAEKMIRSGGPSWPREEHEELPGYRERCFIRYMGLPYMVLEADNLLPIIPTEVPFSGHSYGDWSYGMWDLLYGFEYAVSYDNSETNLHLATGSYYSFSYATEEGWAQSELQPQGWGYVDLDQVEDGDSVLNQYVSLGANGDQGFSALWTLPLKMWGYFEQNQFHPMKVWEGQGSGDEALLRMNDIEKVHAADNEGLMQWDIVLDRTRPELTATDTYQTIYIWNPDGIRVDLDRVIALGYRYEDLTELLEHWDVKDEYQKQFPMIRDSLWETVIVHKRLIQEDGEEYVFGLAVQCWPIPYVMARAWPVYLISLAMALLVMWLVLRKLMKHLTMPLGRMTYGIEHGTTVVPRDTDWQELHIVAEYLAETKRTMAGEAAKLQQTQNALEYAQNAEEYRKQLISNITHELKTPLAVIHSYAESLQEGLAEEKKTYYLDVILSESERMDGMVLQMLDLSRLEAGKVKLTMDHFSLLQLVRSVTDKFAPLLSQKQLELTYVTAEEFLITADEGRMEQVITNLLSNAHRYTEPGGKIRIGVKVFDRQAQLIVENTAPPLSDEALEKIWDSFYRADPSRTERGTGLGLTLVKQIVELHGGSCQVENVCYGSKGSTVGRSSEGSLNWVSFRLTIPLG